jgi:hypothetical protein
MMKAVVTGLAAVLIAPLLLLVAIALGPVAIGIVCAIGFGLIVFVLINIASGAGLLLERAGMRLTHRSHGRPAH